MRRKIHNPTVVRSSIVLLQERFRELQRVKEMRKKREVRKMLTSEPKPLNSNPTMRQFFHPELIIPSRSPPHVSLCLGSSSSQRMQEYNKSTTIEDSTHNQLQASCKNIYDWDSGSDSSVDTSLHL